MKTPLILITALLVLLIAALAGGVLLVLRQTHDRAASETAAETVIRRGTAMASHLINQTPPKSPDGDLDWSGFSTFVRNLYAVEKGLQYVSVTRDGIVVFHEQTTLPDGTSDPSERPPDASITMHRELLQTGTQQIPVVAFAATSSAEPALNVEVALRKEIVLREVLPAGTAISSMFRLSLLTVSIAFGACTLLVVLMMRREIRHEALRTEQEHLAFSGMVANGIVHDFRNPMSSLKLDIQMLHREVGESGRGRPERITALTERVRQTLDRMDEVFKAFLFASRPDQTERTTLDITTCVRESVATLASRFERSKLCVNIQPPEAPLTASLFAASFRRALINILTNAIEFSPVEGGSVDIHIRGAAGNITIDIADQGPGIPVKDRKRVFEMFVTTRPEGTGLGLFLANAAVERSGGTIAMVDPPAGKGTCVRIMIPSA